jgi:ubiquinone/menaquinone biosynthesis C-methylase UbiE
MGKIWSEQLPAVQIRMIRPTHQLNQLLSFYCDGLGFEIKGSFQNHDGYDGVLVGLPDERYHFEIIQHENAVPCPAPSKDNKFVFYIPNLEDRNKIVKRLGKLGYDPVEPENRYWNQNGIEFEDPDGWRIVLYHSSGSRSKVFHWHQEAEKQWNEKAVEWSQNSKNMWENGSRKTIVPFIQQYVEKGSAILDAGCGDGYGAYKLAKAGYAVTGVDISKEMIETANKKSFGLNLSFYQGDILEIPAENESFQCVMAINSLEWTEVPVQALLEIKRITKTGGFLCAGILGPTAFPRINSYRRLYGEEVICNTMMPWEFEKLAVENGFRIIDEHGVYKKGVKEEDIEHLPKELRQSLTFMWVFMLQKK